MRWHDDQSADRRKDRVKSGTGKANSEHQTHKEKEKGAANTYDDRRDVAIMGKAGSFRRIAHNSCNHDGAE